MTFQTTVNFERALGVPGEILFDGPCRTQSAILHSASAAYNIVGATACTMTTAASDADPNVPIIAAAGGTNLFAGILCNPKTYAAEGTTAGTLEPTMTLPNDWNVELITMGFLVVTLPAAAAPGDSVAYDTTTGALSTVTPFIGTGSIATSVGVDTLTISAVTAGVLGVGSLVTGPNIAPGTYITALGSGTGGAGTYITTPLAQTAGSAAVKAAPIAGSGKALVPNAVVDRYAPTGAGLGVIRLTN